MVQDFRAFSIELCTYQSVRAELVEAGAQGFDKLSLNGLCQ
jgi:hypothetical protein